MRNKRILSFLILIFLAAYSKAYAHRVYFFAYAEGDKVIAEGYFIDGRKAINSHVEVFDEASGKKLLEGKTNTEGQFLFSPPKGKKLRLTINAGMGHKAEFSMPSAQPETLGDTAAAVPAQKQNKTGTAPSSVNMAELKKVINTSLDERLRPIIIGIEKSANSGTSVQSIIGGIGYIFGLMGIAMYFSGKNKSS